MPEFNYDRDRIEESLQFIAGEIKEYESEYASKKFNNYQEDKKLMDRTVENFLTVLIEVLRNGACTRSYRSGKLRRSACFV